MAQFIETCKNNLPETIYGIVISVLTFVVGFMSKRVTKKLKKDRDDRVAEKQEQKEMKSALVVIMGVLYCQQCQSHLDKGGNISSNDIKSLEAMYKQFKALGGEDPVVENKHEKVNQLNIDL